jgi:lysophospholipase L1-like esterase
MSWTDALRLGIEGRGFPDAAHPYDRLPADARGRVSDAVWTLQQHSAGMAVRFRTTSPEIGVRWRLRFPELAMDHMPATGVSGVDLYAQVGGRLRYAGTGRPTEYPVNSTRLPGSGDGQPCTFLLYLPLYNGVESVELEVGDGHGLEAAAPAASSTRPVCFYGTSIVQGGCASRPGMAYPAIVGRHLGLPTVNLGFSGSGRAEPEIAELLSRLDPAGYVLDPLPNMATDTVSERMEGMVRALRRAHPDTPILLVEHLRFTKLPRADERQGWEEWQRKNDALRDVTVRLANEGLCRIRRLGWQGLIGDDEEGTVDGVHPTDLGFARMAASISGALGALLP